MKKKSTHIHGINYDKDAKTLEITFHNGSVYKYHDVPEHAHVSLHGAKSHGKHFSENIKDNYKYTKIK